MTFIKTIQLSILFSLILFSCQSNKNEAAVDNPEPSAWCVLIDMSGVRANHEMRKQYADNMRKIMDHINPGDQLLVSVITESSANELNHLHEGKFPVFNPSTTNTRKLKKEHKKFMDVHEDLKNNILKSIQDSILNSQRMAGKTEILSALQVSSQFFKNHADLIKKLVIFSDMEEYGRDYQFGSASLSDAEIDGILQKESRKPQGLPVLNGTEVYVAGAHSKTSDHLYRVRKFWLRYFNACGANLTEEHYGATLNGL